MATKCETGLISKLLETKDMQTIQEYQIKPSFFIGAHKQVYNYIVKHVRKHGTVPTVRVIEDKFPDYDLYTYKKKPKDLVETVGTEEVLSYWCDELKTKVKHNKMVDMVEDVAENLEDLSTEDAYERLRTGLAELDNETSDIVSVKINDTAEDRKKMYLERVNSGGMLGISTGFNILDYITKGWIDECLITIVASTGVGKTWLEVLFGSNALLQGCTVQQFVTEMSTSLMQDRYDAMLFSKLHSEGMNYKLFKSGRLSPKMQKEYFEFLDEELPSLEPLYVETATGVMAMEQRIKEVNPDIVLVDAVYLMEDDQNARDDWLRVAHITRDLKKLAKRLHKPIIINTQLDEKTAKKTSPKLGDIKYTQAIGQDCLPKDTIVLTEQGYRRVQNLAGDCFKVFDGEKYKKATCTFAGKKQITSISYRGNEFNCSPNHKLFVYDNEIEEFVWKRAKDLEANNDFLLEQNFMTKDGFEHVVRVLPERGRTAINIPIEATYDMGMLLGIFIGDGCIKPVEKGQVTVSCGQDIEYAELCIHLVKELFGLEGIIRETTSSTSGNIELLSTWYSRQFSDWLRYFICDGRDEKTIKFDFLEMNRAFRLGLLAGLIQSDGSCMGQVEFVTSIYENAQAFSLLCKTFGVTTRYDYNANGFKGKNRVRLMTSDLVNLSGVKLVGTKKEQFENLMSSKQSGRLPKPESFVKKACSRWLSANAGIDKNSNIYKSVKLGSKTGQLGQRYFDEILQLPYKFMQVDDVVTIEAECDMWDIQVFSDDKRVITNGLVTHNSDVVITIYRDEVMINDREMAMKVLKNREGEGGTVRLTWDFTCMDFSEIYSDVDTSEKEENNSSIDDTISVDDLD